MVATPQRTVETPDGEDSVVAHVHQWGRGKGSGATVEDSHRRCRPSAMGGQSFRSFRTTQTISAPVPMSTAIEAAATMLPQSS